MSFIKWKDGYNTGVAQFDREHHKIVELIDLMFHAIRDKSEKEVVEKVCDDILAYTLYHFDNEERAMERVNFPELAEHAAEHARLKEEAGKLKQVICDHFPQGTNELYRFLREWLVEHIEGCDKKYAPYLAGNEDTAESSGTPPTVPVG